MPRLETALEIDCPACGRELAADGVCENRKCQICGLPEDPEEKLRNIERFVLFMTPAVGRVQ